MENKNHILYRRFPPSEPCSCDVCRYFCHRPGWPLVSEARSAIESGLAGRLMLEFSPDRSFAVLAPAFRGNEAFFALAEYSVNICTFYSDGKCRIFGKPYQPIECRFCHHSRLGSGMACHEETGRDWNTAKGKRLVRQWLLICGLGFRNLESVAGIPAVCFKNKYCF